MNQKDSKIAFTHDIIREASKELGIPETKVRSVYDVMMMYLKHLVQKTDAVAIFIPYIGTLHVKVWYLFKKIKEFESRGDEENLEIYKSKKAKVDEHIQKTIKNKEKESRHIQHTNISNYWYNNGKTIQEIEEIQNAR